MNRRARVFDLAVIRAEQREIPASEQSFRKLARRFEVHMAEMKYAEETVSGYRAGLSCFAIYLEVVGADRIQDVTPELLEGFAYYLYSARTEEGGAYSPFTVTGYFSGIRCFFAWLAAVGVILADPTRRLENPKRPLTLPRNLVTPEEVARLFDAPNLSTALGYRDRAVMELIYATGVRTKELRFLDVADVDFQDRTLRVRMGKPKKERFVPLLSPVAAILAEYLKGPREALAKWRPEEPALFVTKRSTRLSHGVPSEIVARYRAAACIEKPVTPLALRHAMATHLLAAGVSIRHIQELMGHRSVETTTIYAKVTPVDLQAQLSRFHPRQKERRHGRVPEGARRLIGRNERIGDNGPQAPV